MKNLSKERRQGLEFHVKVDDYFASLATLLDLLRQSLGDSAWDRRVADSLEKSVEDLMYLHRNFKIIKKR